MAIPLHKPTEQGRVNPAPPEYGETRFERRPWEMISESREDPFPVTLWIGLKALVVAVTMPGMEPDDLSLSVQGTRLSLQGCGRTGSIRKDIDLPYSVEMPPIRVKDGQETLYLLLQRK